MLHTTARAREKILVYGDWGSGKSYARNRLIGALRASGSDAKVFVIDTDDTRDRALDAYGDGFLEHVEWAYVNAWEDWLEAAERFAAKIGPDDWLVIDRIDLAWAAAQDYYVRRVFGVDSAEFFLQFAADLEANPRFSKDGNRITEGSPLAGAHGQRWDHIKRTYAQFVSNALFPRTTVKERTWGHPGHVLACAGEKDVNREKDDAQTVSAYGGFGKKPAGEKNLPSQFHSVLWLSGVPGDWRYSTGREREGREYVRGAGMGDFVLTYLVGVAGWEF